MPGSKEKWAVEVSSGGFKKLSFIAPGLGWR